jgi:hypothetical protein
MKFNIFTCSNKGLTAVVSNIVLTNSSMVHDTVSDLVADNPTLCPITSYELKDSTGGALTAEVS